MKVELFDTVFEKVEFSSENNCYTTVLTRLVSSEVDFKIAHPNCKDCEEFLIDIKRLFSDRHCEDIRNSWYTHEFRLALLYFYFKYT